MLKRPREAIPADVGRALGKRAKAAYAKRPAYQRNDYLRWIKSAKTDATRAKRISQMIDELARGDVYMNMSWRPRD
jgi:uncharacterized protein YdeI (YjbR/CyaY-like superfamily)